MKKTYLFFILVFCLTLVNCAKRGIPEGGPKDETPPVLINAEPEINTINFDEDRIRLFFDEYIKLKDFRKQLVVSPPIDKSFYTINPQSGASKFIQIDIKEKLDQNTTYVFNFGESVVDNNEENKLPFFNYVFSTGNYIDSLKISGNIKSVFQRESENFISTFLYPVDEKFNDSVIYNGLPNYVGSTLDSTNFKMTNLKKGKYLFIALKDENNNYKFDPEFEKIGFTEKILNIPMKDSLDIRLFKEKLPFKSFKPFLESNNRIGFGFKGDYVNTKIELIDSLDIKSVLTKNKETDTLNYWFKDYKYDSLRFKISNSNYEKKYTIKYKELDKDSLILSPSSNSVLELNDSFKIYSNIPISEIDEDKIQILNKDSVSVPFTAQINKNKFDIDFYFEVLPNDNYTLDLFPNALKDFFDSLNDLVLKMVDLIMLTAPYAVFALLANVIVSSNDPELLYALLFYALVVLAGLGLMFCFYMLMLFLITKKNPFLFVKQISPAQLLAFSTSSSAATLPVTMNCIEKRVGVDREVSSFVLPVGATINMDGTSLYQAVAAVFIAQALNFDLTFSDQLMIILTALLASIGSAAVPGAGMVMLVIVLESIGFPADKLGIGLALIFAVDRPLDMCRTVINVTGDATVSTVIAKLEGKLKIK